MTVTTQEQTQMHYGSQMALRLLAEERSRELRRGGSPHRPGRAPRVRQSLGRGLMRIGARLAEDSAVPVRG